MNYALLEPRTQFQTLEIRIMLLFIGMILMIDNFDTFCVHTTFKRAWRLLISQIYVIPPTFLKIQILCAFLSDVLMSKFILGVWYNVYVVWLVEVNKEACCTSLNFTANMIQNTIDEFNQAYICLYKLQLEDILEFWSLY